MIKANTQCLSDDQNEEIIDSLTSEIASLKIQLTKKDDRMSTLDAMLNQIMQSHNAEIRAYEDLEDKLKGVIDMLRKRVPHRDILEYLKEETVTQCGRGMDYFRLDPQC